MLVGIIACMSLAVTAANSPPVTATNAIPKHEDAQKRIPHVIVTNVVPVKMVYPNDPGDEFCVEEWAEKLAEDAAQGLHIRNGTVAVVVRLESDDNEHPTLVKLRAKFRGVEFLRWHFSDLPKDFSAPCRVLVCNQSDSEDWFVVVLSFALKDIQQGEQK